MTQDELLQLIDRAVCEGWQELDLKNESLTALPPEIGRLTRLQKLVLGPGHSRQESKTPNQLAALPLEIGQLTQLFWLNLSSNQLAALPLEIGQLTQLFWLNLSSNQLSELPPEIGQLTRLQTLNLSGNRLAALPPEIGQLTQLKFLDLRSNQLSKLPPEIGQLTRLQELDLSGNPWVEPFNKLTRGPQKQLFAYLHSLAHDIPQYEAKVLLVGEGAVGKSSLLRALRGETFDPDLSTTHGIEIKQVQEPHPDAAIEDNLILNFWDFGGQEVYRITHQFFFSENALYLLVWKPREGQEENNLEGWLERIHLRVGDEARVIIVATHCKERQPELDYPALRRKYPNLLAGHLAVDNALLLDDPESGIPQLHQKIAAVVASMEHVGTPFNRRWLAARDELKSLEKTHIAYGEYEAVCARHGMDAVDAAALIGMLHTLGHIVYYDSEGLRDFVVLKPEWLTKAIGYVLEDTPTRTAGGILDHRRLNAIWCEHGDPERESYTPDHFPYFLRLMEQYDISARIESEDASLVSQLVPYERPSLSWEAEDPTKQAKLSLLVEMAQNPPGLVAWATVRNHRWSVDTHWRSGVFLRHEDGHEALLDFTSRRRSQLALTVRGEYPAHFMHLLQDGLEVLIRERWPYLDYNLFVPCPTYENGARCSGRFPLKSLHKARAKGIRATNCHSCWEEIDVGRLLEGYILPVQPLSQQLIDMEQHLKTEYHKSAQRISAEVGQLTRRVLRALMDEAHNGPRLFTLSPIYPTQAREWWDPPTREWDPPTRARKWWNPLTREWDPRNLASEELKLTLWCEHPGHEHALGAEGQYSIRNPRQWVSQVAPLALLSLQVLRIAAPIAGGAIGLAQDTIKDQYEPDFKFMDGLLKATGEEKSALEAFADAPDHRNLPVLRAEGAAMRAYHRLLAKANKSWEPGDAVIYSMVEGDLDEVIMRRVTDKKTGDVLWVCPKHYKVYDPGLPHIPEQLPA